MTLPKYVDSYILIYSYILSVSRAVTVPTQALPLTSSGPVHPPGVWISSCKLLKFKDGAQFLNDRSVQLRHYSF